MDWRKIIPRVVIIGILVLFFFPNPEENLLAYLGVALLFIILIVYLSRRKK